jgi:aquaporin Z
MVNALKEHWPEYLIEAAGLGFFMLSACTFAVLIFHPASFVPGLIENAHARRVLMGGAMGLTAISIIYSPWGKRSGAHINPATTLMFFRLGKIKGRDAFFYAAAQFVGGIAGVLAASALLGALVADPSVNYVATKPGRFGVGAAFVAEAFISFLLMMVVLTVSNTRRLSRFTGLFVGALVAVYISVEDPISGMSMNPARTFSSAFAAQVWNSLWVYFTAPPLGMLLAAELYTRLRGARRVYCAKYHHHNSQRCIFNCEFDRLAASSAMLTIDAARQRHRLPTVSLQLF